MGIMKIDPQMLSELITLLTPFLNRVEEREALLFRAFGIGHSPLEQIDCSGNTSTFLPRLIRSLVEYNDGADELIQLLKTVKIDVGLDKQEKIDRIINSLNASQRLSQNSPPGASKLQDLHSQNFDVFLCYNSQDRAEVLRIAEDLDNKRIRVWFDEWDVPPGQRWQKLIQEQITQIRSAAVFVGKNGIGPWQDEEIEGFLQEFRERECALIPVLLPSAPSKPVLPPFLRNRRWVDFGQPDPNPIDHLILGIRGESPRSLRNSQ
jgi:hypothetical protein